MNNTFLKLVCITLSIGAACLSAFLTVSFMYNIGLDTNQPQVMASLGLVLDLAKCAIPLFLPILWLKKKYISALFGTVLAICLSAVSFSASVAALEQGVNASKMNSDSFKRIESQITDYRSQIEDLKTLAASQRKIKQITKSSQTLEKVTPLLAKIEDLTKQQSNLSANETVTAKYGFEVSYITAAALELLTWFLVSVSHALFTPKHTKTQKDIGIHTEDKGVVYLVEKKEEYIKTHAHTEDKDTHENTQIAVQSANDDCSETQCENCLAGCEINETKAVQKECNSELYIRIRDAVLAKSVKPSHRAIKAHFEGIVISRKLLTSVLEDLVEFGFLRKFAGNKGYTYADVELKAVN